MINSLVKLSSGFSNIPVFSNIGIIGKSTLDRICHVLLDENKDINKMNGINFDLENKNIALVGNGPNLTNKNIGDEIDGNDIVIRLNKGILNLDQTKNDTGIKTDLFATFPMDVLLSSNIKNEVKENIDKILIVTPYKSKIIGSTNILYLQNVKSFNSKELFYIDEEIFIKMMEILQGFIPSTGFVLFYYLCNYVNYNNLSLYGFTFNSFNRIYNQKMPTGNIHNFEKEKNHILDIIENNDNINIFH